MTKKELLSLKRPSQLFTIGVTHKDQISLGIDDRQVSHVSYGPSSTDVQPQKGDKNVINNKK